MSFSFTDILIFIALGVGLAILLAPLEALLLWAGWLDNRDNDEFEALEPVSYSDASPQHFIVFLDGISKGSYKDLDYITDFLTALQNALPKARIISDVLPYSVFNTSLTDQTRPLARFWERVEHLKFQGSPLGFLINIRNIFQVMVSADWRYGLVYNLAMAKLILRHLIKHGYNPSKPLPITIIGYSGGGQMAAGCASLIGKALDIPVTVISIAGVMAGTTDLSRVQSWYQVTSDRDPVERIGAIIFPLRWRIIWFSNWNRAKRQGKVKLLQLNGAKHDNKGSYMDKNALVDTGQSQLERTIAMIVNITQQTT